MCTCGEQVKLSLLKHTVQTRKSGMPWLIRACSLGHAIHSKRRVTEVAQTNVGAAGGKGDHRAIGPDAPEQLCCPLTKQGCRHMAAKLPHLHLALLPGCADPNTRGARNVFGILYGTGKNTKKELHAFLKDLQIWFVTF